MDPTLADFAVHIVLVAVAVWAIAGNPNREKARQKAGALRYPWISRVNVALPVAAFALAWIWWSKGAERSPIPLLAAVALIAFWIFAREVRIDDQGVWNSRLGNRMRSGVAWDEIDRARVTRRRSGGRDRTTIELMDKEDRVSLVHGGALIDSDGFIAELKRRGLNIEEPQDA